MLTEQELLKIFSWLPYREDWIVDRNQQEDNIAAYYGGLISDLTQSDLFDTYYSQNGQLGNYLEFICYPQGHNEYNGAAILVCVSLCSPIAAYGQTIFHKTTNSWGWGWISADALGIIADHTLAAIEKEIVDILKRYHLTLIDREFASRLLPDEIANSLKHENHNGSTQYLHGLFQKTD
jgi:hypothetical protein